MVVSPQRPHGASGSTAVDQEAPRSVWIDSCRFRGSFPVHARPRHMRSGRGHMHPGPRHLQTVSDHFCGTRSVWIDVCRSRRSAERLDRQLSIQTFRGASGSTAVDPDAPCGLWGLTTISDHMRPPRRHHYVHPDCDHVHFGCG